MVERYQYGYMGYNLAGILVWDEQEQLLNGKVAHATREEDNLAGHLYSNTLICKKQRLLL